MVIDLGCCVQLLYHSMMKSYSEREQNLSLHVWLNHLKMIFRFRSDRVMCIAVPLQCCKAYLALKLLDQRNEKFIKPLNNDYSMS